MTAWMPHWREGQFLLFPSKALSRITPLSVFKKLEDQASNRKILRKEAHPLCSPRRKQELDPAFQMPHPILHIDDIYSYNANMRNARALILTDTRVHMFFNAENPFGGLAGSIQLHQPQNQSQAYLLPAFSFTKNTERHQPNPILAEDSVRESLKRDSVSKD